MWDKGARESSHTHASAHASISKATFKRTHTRTRRQAQNNNYISSLARSLLRATDFGPKLELIARFSRTRAGAYSSGDRASSERAGERKSLLDESAREETLVGQARRSERAARVLNGAAKRREREREGCWQARFARSIWSSRRVWFGGESCLALTLQEQRASFGKQQPARLSRNDCGCPVWPALWELRVASQV